MPKYPDNFNLKPNDFAHVTDEQLDKMIQDTIQRADKDGEAPCMSGDVSIFVMRDVSIEVYRIESSYDYPKRW